MKKYLENSICNFTPLFNIDYTKKKNIISCCFFKKYNSHKDLSVYLDGIQALYHSVTKYYKVYSIRLFIDNSIYTDNDIMSILKKLDKIEIVLYDCLCYKIGDNYHQGLFGTIIRFFPMFNFPNNDANIVILSGIDNHALKKYIDLLKILGSRINDLYLIKFSNAGEMFKNKELYNHVYKNFILDYIKPQEIVCLKQIDSNVIINFLKKLDPKIKYSYYVNDENDENDENDGPFIYGIDEYFLNNEYIKYIVGYRLPFVDRLNYNVFNLYYYQINKRIDDWLEKDKKIFNLLLNKILKYIKTKSDKDIEDKFNIILKIIDKNDKESIKLKYKLYKLFIKIKNKKRYKFLFNTVYNNLLLDKYIGIYEFSEMKFYNINIKSFFEKKLSFSNKKIRKLKQLVIKYKSTNINLNNKPNFLIIGVQKGGTESLVHHLNQHNDIFVYDDEIHFFDNQKNCNKDRCDIEKYYKYFESSSKKFKGEKTPVYILIRNCIDNIYRYLPNIKLIILLREPIQRCFSHYNMLRQKGFFKRTLIEEIEVDKNIKLKDITKHGSYMLQRGFYIDQIEYVLSKFPRENVYIGISEEFRNNPDKFNEVIKFIGAEPLANFKIEENIHARTYEKRMTKEEFNYLYKIYKPYNERLYKFLGRRIESWETYIS